MAYFAPYMGAPVELTTLPNGAITNADSQRKLARTMYLEPTVDRVAPGVTVFGGDGFLNLTLIEGDDGLIVYDTGEILRDGERFLDQIRSISDKPIAAILYSHSHYVHGSRALIGDRTDVLIIGHPRVNTNLASSLTGTIYGETAPTQNARLTQQFNHLVPSSGEDAAAGAHILLGKSGMLPVNTPVSHGERMTIAGVTMVFYTEHGSDTDDCMTVHIPERGVVLNNFLWPFAPNIYTLRGAKYRDPRDWRKGLELIHGLEPEILVNTHARALAGREVVRDAIEHVIDGLNLLLDQTLRGILRGLGPDDLRDFVRLTPELAGHPNLAEIYGEISHIGPYLYQHALGWFDGDAANINPLPLAEQASRLVQAMGGRDTVLRLAAEAQSRSEYAWALQLVQYLYRLNPCDVEVRALKASALRAMGRVTPAHTVRSWYITQARALLGEVDVPRLQFNGPRLLAMSPPAVSMEQYRVRIDPDRVGRRRLALALRFTDQPAHHGWRIRRGVAAFVENMAAREDIDVTLETSFEAWLLFFSCRHTLEQFLSSAQVVTGSIDSAREFFSYFDFYAPADNHLVPSL